MTSQPEARFVREGDWLVVRLSGPYSLQWFLGVIADVGQAMRNAPAAALLVDTHELYGTIDDLDRYRFAVAISEQQIAAPLGFVGSEPIVDAGRFGESVARNRGVNVRVFTDEPAAREWLREQTGGGPPTLL